MKTEYITVRTEPNRWAEAAAAIAALPPAPDMADILGGFTPQIGLSINSVLVLARGTEESFAPLHDLLPGLADVAGFDRVRLDPVQERDLSLLRPEDAVFTNRWFHVREPGAAEFEEDTLAAWDTFEGQTDSQVVGLWKAAPRAGVVSYLLVARYADLATWDRSRFYNRSKADNDGEWVERFRRRREQMVDSSVITTRCAFGPSG
ncbi:MAG: hypothetical protein ACU0DK_05815 [Pseudooceanicola sp.]